MPICMTPEALNAEERCLVKLAVWARGRGYIRIPPELVLALSECVEDVFRAGELSARMSGVRLRALEDEITKVRDTGFVRG